MPTGPDEAFFTRRGFVRASGAAAALLLAGYGSLNDDPATAATPIGAGTTASPPSPTAGPYWLQGNFAPVPGETTTDQLRVDGRIPRSLLGLYARNGPNQQVGTSPHWFVADGMMHGIWLGDGTARRYSRRWVRTPLLGKRGFTSPPGRTITQSDVSLVHYGERLIALGELGHPNQIDAADLATIGTYDFGGKLGPNMTAHPKIDPVTGHLYFFGYAFSQPFVTLYHADATGRMIASQPVELPRAVMMHDLAITETKAILFDLPCVLDRTQKGMPFRWDPAGQARLGVVDRDVTATATVRWFDIDPCYVFHTVNAYDIERGLVVEAIRYPHLWVHASTDTFPPASLWRWTIDFTSGKVAEQRLDDRVVEFPTGDPRYLGRPGRTSFAVQSPALSSFNPGPRRPSGLVRYDAYRKATSWNAPAHLIPDEGFFVPAGPNAAEGEGWLLSLVYDVKVGRSDLMIFDAQALDDGPRARVHLPDRVPFGFHGWFVPSARPS
jgi:carotenoid cleavage dioxygenase